MGGLPREAAQLASRIILPATWPRVATTCPFVCTSSLNTQPAHSGAPSSDPGKEEGKCSARGSPPSLAIDVSPCSPKAGSAHHPLSQCHLSSDGAFNMDCSVGDTALMQEGCSAAWRGQKRGSDWGEVTGYLSPCFKVSSPSWQEKQNLLCPSWVPQVTSQTPGYNPRKQVLLQ